MKSTARLRHFLCIASSALLAATSAHAAILSWDGGAVNIAGTGNGVSLGTAGTWNNSLTNWDAGAVSYAAWVDANLDTAFFGGTAGLVTLSEPITVGGLTFFSNSGYTIAGSTLTLGAANTTIGLIAQTGTTSSVTITSAVVGTGNVILSSISPTSGSTLNLNAGVGIGWSGTTTINAGMTLAMTGDGTGSTGARALQNSTGITLNGGAIAITNDNSSSSQRATTRVSDSAVITSNSGTISLAISTVNSAAPVSETYGSVALTSGQLNVTLSSARSASHTTIVLSDLTRSGASNTSAVAFARAATTGGVNVIRVNAVTSDTAVNQIIGPWATSGNTASQFDYAVYTLGNGTIASANIAASNQSTWTTATNSFTADRNLGSGAITLSGGTKNITALRSITASAAVTATNATDVINLVGHTYANGDAFVLNSGTAPSGLTAFIPYFVINATADTFQLSTTQGGPLSTFTTDGTGLTGIGAILVSTGNNLGTTGILNGSTNSLYIAATGTGVVTLPSTTAGNLHVSAGAGPIVIYAPITNNTGALTLVKNGSQALTLAGTNTYTGGTVVNAGTLNWTNANQLGNSGSRNLTVNGIATLNGNDGVSLDALAVGSGGVATFNTAGYTFTSTTGTGVISYRPTTLVNKTLNLGSAGAFTGTVQASMGALSNAAPNVQFSSLGDGAGSALQFTGGSLDGGQTASFTLAGTAPVVFNNRQVQILSRISNTHGVLQSNLINNSALAANIWTINTDLAVLTNQTGRNLNLRGSNTGNNAFNGVISDGNVGGTINVTKQDAGTWLLGGANTYSGSTSISGGTLIARNGSALGKGSVTVATQTGLVYNAKTDTPLSIGGTLGITGGTTTLIGASIGSNLTTARINVAGNATTTAAGVRVNIYGNTFSTTVGGNGSYTLLQGGGTNTLNNATYTLGTVFNNTNFTVGAISKTANDVTVAITAVSPITAAYWKGGLTGNTGVWSASNGSTQSNWVTTAGGANQALVPTAIPLNFSATTPGTMVGMTLGTDMTVDSLIVSNTATAFGLVNDGYKLTITPAAAADGILLNAGLAASPSIGTDVVLGANQTWTNSSGRTFTVSGSISGSGSLTKAGVDTTVLSGINTYTGATTVSAGTLQLDGSTHASSTVGIGTAGTLSGSGTVNGNATLTGSGIINKSSGTIVGTLSVTGGNWNGAGSVTGLVTSSSGTFTIGSGANLTANGGVSVTGGTTAVAGTLTGNATVASAILSGSGLITGTTGVTSGTINGSGLTLTGLITFNSTSNILSGTQTATAGVTLAAGATVTQTGTLTGNLNTTNTGTFTANGTVTGNATVASSGTLAGSGSIGGTTGVTSGTINGSGLTLTGLTTFNSTGNILSGTQTASVSLAGAAALANSGTVTGGIAVEAGTLTGTGGSFSAASTLNGGTINLSSGSFGSTLGVTGGNWNGAGSVTSLVTSSSGTFTIGTGANLTASSGLSVTGGTLTGSGAITGNTTIGSSATHNAGGIATVGTQAITGSLDYASSSIFDWDLNANSTASGFDTVSATGGVTVGASTVFNVILGATAAAGLADTGNAFWNTPYITQTWSMSSIFGAAISGSFTNVTSLANPITQGSFTIDGSNLTWTAVPEPTSALVGLLIGAGLLRRRRNQSPVASVYDRR